MLACWGNNIFGQTTVPVAFRQAYLVDTTQHTCALAFIRSKSTVGCWGDNRGGKTNLPEYIYGNHDGSIDTNSESGNRNSYNSAVKYISQLSTGLEMTAGVDTFGELLMWGNKE